MSANNKPKFRVLYMTTETVPHVYCRVFVALTGGTWAATGNLTMRKDEFSAFQEAFHAEFVKEVT